MYAAAGTFPTRHEATADLAQRVEHHPERPVATMEQVFELAEAIGPTYRAMVLLASFTGLRLGELHGLASRDVDVAAGTVKVRSTCDSSQRALA